MVENGKATINPVGDDQNSASSNDKLRVLMLHGYRQNAEVFKQKTGSFRKMVHKWAQFTYVTAPHKVYLVDNIDEAEEVDVDQAVDNDQYGWFFNRDNKTYRGIRKGGPAIGFEESVRFIEEVYENEGPFDGLVGFSQGACFLGLLCDLQRRGMLKFNFKFAIMASGFKSNSLPHHKYYGDTISLRSMHVYGANDKIIPTEMCAALSECFDDPTVVVHHGGHYFPASAAQKSTYQKFFKEMAS